MTLLSLPPEIDQPLLSAIAGILKDVYDDHVSQFNPGVGRNAMWFGFSVFCHLGPALRDGLQGLANVRVEQDGIGFVVCVGPHRMWPNKLGATTDEPIGSSFPRASRRSVAMAAINLAQMTLGLEGIYDPVIRHSLVDAPASPAIPSRWVIGHFGNGEAGLLAAYLCAPLHSDGVAIREWQGWIPIYGRDGDIEALPAPGPPEPAPAPVDLAEIDIWLRDDSSQPEHDAG